VKTTPRFETSRKCAARASTVTFSCRRTGLTKQGHTVSSSH
jgi:hypothetical protein